MKRSTIVAAVALLAVVLVRPDVQAATTSHRPTLPPGLPPATYVPEPALPAAAGWGLPDAFPRVSGTGRLAHGAVYWSDFLYDDHGAVGNPAAGQAAYGTYTTPSGSYTYPEGPDANNGADILRVAIAKVAGATRWRVDWNTLADPIAAFLLDTGDGGAEGAAGLTAPGTDAVLTVTRRRAVLDLVDSTPPAELPVAVDTLARTFVVDVPDAILPAAGTWQVRMVSGRSTATDGFAEVSPEDGWLPGQAPVYNVAFRTHEQEPLGGWREAAQAAALQAADITPFVLDVDWTRLSRKETTPLAAPRGISEHWYVSAHEFGEGVLLSSEQVRAKFLGRVQPYSVYVPEDLDLTEPVALTFLLHSFSTNYTQYEDKPELLKALCDQRGSVCVTPLGRGPDGFNAMEAELDLWELVNRVGRAVPVDWERTALWGFSMGAVGVYRLTATYPDVFAAGAVIAGGAAGGGTRPVAGGPDLASASPDLNTTPLLGNLRGVPLFIGQGALDELNPLPGAVEPPMRLDELGYRHRWQLYPAEAHTPMGLKDGFEDSARYLDILRRTDPCPRQVTYAWWPGLDRPDLGIGTVGAYWVRNLTAARTAPGVLATVDATSHAIITPDPIVERTRTFEPSADLSPAYVQEITWRDGTEAKSPKRQLDLVLRNVAHLTVNATCARLGGPAPVTLVIDTATQTVIDVVGRGKPTRHTVPAGRHTLVI